MGGKKQQAAFYVTITNPAQQCGVQSTLNSVVER